MNACNTVHAPLIEALNSDEIEKVDGALLPFIGFGIGIAAIFGGGMAFGYAVGRNLDHR